MKMTTTTTFQIPGIQGAPVHMVHSLQRLLPQIIQHEDPVCSSVTLIASLLHEDFPDLAMLNIPIYTSNLCGDTGLESMAIWRTLGTTLKVIITNEDLDSW
jgi:hypothetical protein